MNNWDKRPKLTVVYGAPDVPKFAVEDVVDNLIAQHEYSDSSVIYNEGTYDKHPVFHVMDNSDIDGEHLQMVLSSLEDHILNTNPDEWMEHYADTMLDRDEELWVSISKGRYHGPNCTVEAYFVSI